ncbi:MAG: NAD(P)-dependent oxidoreductase [Rhizomicrobium sp.]
MKVALIGASGNIGSKIAAELLARGHSVTAIARNAGKAPPGTQAKSVDAADAAALAAVLKGHDAVISSAPFAPGLSPAIIAAVKQSGVKRYIMVGGAGSLEVAPGKMLKDTLTLPDAVRAILDEAAENLKRLRAENELDWTFFSPAAEIGPGERTGKFRLGGDQLVTGADGKSRISYDDYAIALVDELEQGKHIRRRFTVAY